MESKDVNLSKTIAHALRHEPWLYELELDDNGWVSVSQLIDSLRLLNAHWKDLDSEKIIRICDRCSSERFEIEENRIRALYGHSVPGRLIKIKGIPPDILYHGTSLKASQHIKGGDGLRPMRRQYVHLSTDRETATLVGSRKSKEIVILNIRAHNAHNRGVDFYIGNDRVWLADYIPTEFID